MALRHYTLTLSASAQRLSAAFTDPSVGGAEDVPYRQVLLRASGADAKVGGSGVTSTNGLNVNSTTGEPIVFGPFDQGPVKLSQIYALGSGATLHIVGIPF